MIYTDKPFWTCPACDLEFWDKEEKQEHLKEAVNDPMHFMVTEEQLESEEEFKA